MQALRAEEGKAAPSRVRRGSGAVGAAMEAWGIRGGHLKQTEWTDPISLQDGLRGQKKLRQISNFLICRSYDSQFLVVEVGGRRGWGGSGWVVQG